MAFPVLASVSLALSVVGAAGSGFLEARLTGATRDFLESSLMSELAADSRHLRAFEDELRPMYATLPKNEHGNLEPPAVRYALHRHFVHKHGWYIRGLEPLGQAWNTSAPSSATKIPTYIQSILEKRLHGKGMSLHDLAAFAATLLEFVHHEIVGDVLGIYDALNLPKTEPVKQAQADRVVKAYVLQILDGNLTVQSDRDIDEMEGNLREWFPQYEEFQMWVSDLRQTISIDRHRRSLQVDETSLGSVMEAVQQVNDRLGAFADGDCRSIKSMLTDMEYAGTGRVFLSDFYKAGLSGKALFVEHIDYLRNLGALDETNKNHPSVIIANYMTGKANCLTETGFHSVCCFDECQGLMSHLESSIAAPEASPARIAELVAHMQSDTVDAPRNLSASLLSRLGQIADHHDGMVPLHGRLFAQWMHHAYPLECAFPHASGTISPQTQDEYMEATGADDVRAPEEQHLHYANMVKPSEEDSAGIQWLHMEELVSQHRHSATGQSGSGALRKLAGVMAIVSLAVAVTKLGAHVAAPTEGKSVDYII